MTTPATAVPETAPAQVEPPKPEAVAPPAAPKVPAPLHEDPAIAKALEALTPEQRETLLTTGGRNALAANRQEAKDAKAQAATAAETARLEMAQSIGKALGLIKDDEPADPAKLTEQLTQAGAEARQAKVELAIHRAAGGVNADPNALLDSRSFLAKLADVDPNDHLAIAAAVGVAITENPAFLKNDGRRVPAPNPAIGSSAGGAPNLSDQIAAAQKSGDWRAVIHLENQKLTAPQG